MKGRVNENAKGSYLDPYINTLVDIVKIENDETYILLNNGPIKHWIYKFPSKFFDIQE